MTDGGFRTLETTRCMNKSPAAAAALLCVGMGEYTSKGV